MRPRTSHLKPAEHQRAWHLVDAKDAVLGRMAVAIAVRLQGKHLPTVSEHFDCGDAVVVVNASQVRVTGAKEAQKVYVRVTGYPGGRREDTYADLKENYPERIIQKAVQRMLPKNRLGKKMLKKLFVYSGAEHPHGAQDPKPLEIG